MRILSWNVNGIRAVEKKGFADMVKRIDPDIICLQETKAFLDQVPASIRALPYHLTWHDGLRPGYAGTAIFSKVEPDFAKTKFEKFPKFHEDGRVTEARFGKITVLNIYFPNGGERASGQEMLSYKLGFYDELLEYLKPRIKKGEEFVIVGDFNIAHTELDIARPKENAETIGFLPVEREKFSEFLKKADFVDVFREKNKNARDEYTWWSYRAIGARDRNVGWRIDYAVISKSLLPKVKKIEHKQDIFGSDHCPVLLEIKD
jgi:exodeoxyribonuclease-3